MCKTTEALALLVAEQMVQPSIILRVVERLLTEALADNQPKTMRLSHNRLLEVLHYDPLNGHFYWRAGHRRGLRAGCVDTASGYRKIMIDGVVYLAARLVWFYTYGVWPESEIDHKNHVRDDDRLDNLRDVTPNDNGRNREFDNPWGCPGVVTRGDRFVVKFRVDGKLRHFGTYDDPYEAVKVCKTKRKEYGVEIGAVA
jgi:hypothetical protein